jgi:hypothetical protein
LQKPVVGHMQAQSLISHSLQSQLVVFNSHLSSGLQSGSSWQRSLLNSQRLGSPNFHEHVSPSEHVNVQGSPGLLSARAWEHPTSASKIASKQAIPSSPVAFIDATSGHSSCWADLTLVSDIGTSVRSPRSASSVFSRWHRNLGVWLTSCRSAVWAPPSRRPDSTLMSLRRPHPLQRLYGLTVPPWTASGNRG